MNLRPHALGGEMRLQRVAVRGPNDEKMPHRFGRRRHERQHEIAYALELGEIAGGEGDAAGVPGGEVRKLRAQERRLQLAEARVEAEVFVMITHL